ncbi:MAG: hypothetical protein MZV64_23880 [Ignavibacteriales bacterium]|nr:hypothetical protein [Ignavibacteriales bacterium]
MMGDFVDDAIYNDLNTDAEPANDVDMFFNNAGGIRIDWCDWRPADAPASSTGCTARRGPRSAAADLRQHVHDPAVRQRDRRRRR